MINRSLERIDEVLRYPLFSLGDQAMTLRLLLWLGLLFAGLILVTHLLKKWVFIRVLERSRMDAGVRQGVATLLVGGSYDFQIPVESAQKPFFDRIGTSNKKHVVFDGGHVPTEFNDVIREIFTWTDQWMGPVRRTATQ